MARPRRTQTGSDRAKTAPRAADSGAPSSLPAWLAFAVLLAAGVIVYAGSLSAPFHFDDQEAIVENTHIRDLGNLPAVFSAPPQSAVAGRPVVGLSLALNYSVGGLEPESYRLWNIALLVLSAFLVFLVLRRTLAATPATSTYSDWMSIVCALVWLVHPLHTEVVGYVVQRTESTMGVFYLLTLYASIRAMAAREGLRWTVLAVVACALGMASKESMITAPLMVLLYDAVFVADSPMEAIRRRPTLYAGLAASTVVALALNASGPRWRSAGFASGIDPWTYLLNQSVMIVRYLRLAVWPDGLVFDYGPTRAIAFANAWPAFVSVALLGAVTLFGWTRWPRVAFAATWFFVTLAPSSSVVPIATEVGAERRMYLPLVAIVVAGVVGVWTIVGTRWRRARAVLAPVAAVVVVVLGVSSVVRLRDYRDSVILWETVVERRPHGRAHYMLGMALAERGRREEALAQYRLAAADEPSAHHALGVALLEDRRPEEAVGHFRRFLELRPDDYRAPTMHALIGRALLQQHRFSDAEVSLREALRMQPDSLDAQNDLADALFEQRRFGDAEAAYRSVLRVQPGRGPALLNLGVSLVAQGREGEAALAFAEAVRAMPQNLDARLNLGYALASLGRFDEAVDTYREGLAAAPRRVPLLNALALVFAAQGRRTESMAAFQESLKVAPGDPQTSADYEEALRLLAAR